MTPAKCRRLFGRLKKSNPQPTTELRYRSNFELLIAVILSAQATDKSVNLATQKLFRVAKDFGIGHIGSETLHQIDRAISFEG
jgi:endonuclease III